MQDDILINKAQIIKRCIERIKEEFEGFEEEFEENYTKQDSVILNIQRACEASIDIANRVIRINKLEIPQSTRDSFDILQKNDYISEEQCENMKKMVGFRNIAVHDYKRLSIEITKKVVQNHLTDFESFVNAILKSDK